MSSNSLSNHFFCCGTSFNPSSPLSQYLTEGLPFEEAPFQPDLGCSESFASSSDNSTPVEGLRETDAIFWRLVGNSRSPDLLDTEEEINRYFVSESKSDNFPVITDETKVLSDDIKVPTSSKKKKSKRDVKRSIIKATVFKPIYTEFLKKKPSPSFSNFIKKFFSNSRSKGFKSIKKSTLKKIIERKGPEFSHYKCILRNRMEKLGILLKDQEGLCRFVDKGFTQQSEWTSQDFLKIFYDKVQATSYSKIQR